MYNWRLRDDQKAYVPICACDNERISFKYNGRIILEKITDIAPSLLSVNEPTLGPDGLYYASNSVIEGPPAELPESEQTTEEETYEVFDAFPLTPSPPVPADDDLPEAIPGFLSFLVLAASQKMGNRCVAGIDLSTNQLIRLVSSEGPTGNEIPVDFLKTKNGREIQKKDCIAVSFKKKCPLSIQKENVLIDVKTRPILLKPSDITWPLSDEEYVFGDTNPRLTREAVLKCKSSIEIIHVNQLCIYHVGHSGYSRSHPRATFIYKGREYVDFRITDTSFLNEKYIPHATLVVTIPEVPFEKDGYYYKFIAAIYPGLIPVSTHYTPNEALKTMNDEKNELTITTPKREDIETPLCFKKPFSPAIEDSATRSLSLMILTKSAKHSFSCVAGLDLSSGNLIRLVSSTDPVHNEIHDDYLITNDGRVLKEGDCIEVAMIRECPQTIQVENVLIDTTIPPILLEKQNPEWPLSKDKYIFGSTGYFISQSLAKKCHSSIGIFSVKHLCIYPYEKKDMTIKTKASFIYNGAQYHDFSVTDRKYFNKYQEIEKARLVVTLPEDTTSDGKCFKFIAAIYEE